MKNEKFRQFNIDGKNVVFNFNFFNELFRRRANKRGFGITEYEQILGEELGMSREGIHAWRMKRNGPGGIEIIEDLAKALETEMEYLIREKEDDNMAENKSIRKVGNKVVECYKVMVEFFEYIHEKHIEINENDMIEDAIWSLKDKLKETEEDEKEKLQIELKESVQNFRTNLFSSVEKCEETQKILKIYLLELPKNIYDKWQEQVAEVKDIINDYYKSVTTDSPLEFVEECILDVYTKFYDFCEEEIVPKIDLDF